MFFKITEVFNGYGMKRWTFQRPHMLIGITNKVYLDKRYPEYGFQIFMYTLKDFPLVRGHLCCGKLSRKIKNGIYYNGSRSLPFNSFKIVLFSLFFGGDTPAWWARYKMKQAEKFWNEVYASYDEGYDNFEQEEK